MQHNTAFRMQQDRFGRQPMITWDSDTYDWGNGLAASAMITHYTVLLHKLFRQVDRLRL